MTINREYGFLLILHQFLKSKLIAYLLVVVAYLLKSFTVFEKFGDIGTFRRLHS